MRTLRRRAYFSDDGCTGKACATIPGGYQEAFNHKDERAEPGYYEVKLDSGIEVKLAAHVRSGVGEFHFPDNPANRTLLIDLGRNLSREVYKTEIRIDHNLITGSVSSGGLCGHQIRYRVYFAIEMLETPESYGTFDETGVAPQKSSANGRHVGGYVSFRSSIRTVHLRVGISFVSVANATANMKSEIGARGVEAIRREGRAVWNNALNRVRVSGGAEEDRKVFYTALYHALLHPSVFNDVNGE